MHWLNVSIVDLVVVGVVLVSTLFAFWRGFVRETLSIVDWGAAVVAAIYLGPPLAHFLHTYIATPFVASLVAYIAIFVIVFVALSLVSHRISERVRNSPVGPVDRVLGIGFGAVRGLALVGLVYLAFCFVVPARSQPGMLGEPRLLPLIRESGQIVYSLVPERDRVRIAGLADETADPGARLPGQPRRGTVAGQKTYGANDRRALDRLIEATGSGGTTNR